jgi:NADH/NAD ratio-sensing transcriptional regulator Rex
VEEIVSDGDTKGPKQLIARQLLIIGKAAKGQAVHTYDFGHLTKNISNALFDLKQFQVSSLLINVQIKAMASNVRKKLEFYHDKVEFLAEGGKQEKRSSSKSSSSIH